MPAVHDRAESRDLLALQQAQDGVRVLLSFAVGRKQLQQDERTVSAATDAMRIDVSRSTPDQEKSLWAVLDELSCAVAPATLDSIRTLDELVTDLRSRPSIFRNWSHDSSARKAVRWARLWNLAALAGLLLLQIYTLIGSAILREIGRNSGEFRELLRDHPQDADASLSARKAEYENRIEAGYRMVAEWNRPWESILSALGLVSQNGRSNSTAGSAPEGTRQATDPQDRAEDKIAAEQRARSALEALSVYLLPLFYGLLGASTFILRQLREAIDNCTFTLTSIFRHRLRLGIGAVLGITVGLFLSSDASTLGSTPLSLVAIAFLAGYSVEAVFAIFDYSIARIRDALNPGQPPPEMRPTPAKK